MNTELSSSSLRKYDRDVEMDLWNKERNVIVEPKRWKKFCVYTGCHDNQNPFSLNIFSPVHDCVFPLMELTSHKLVKLKMPEDTSLVDVLFDGSFIYLSVLVCSHFYIRIAWSWIRVVNQKAVNLSRAHSAVY